ncbi:MAG: IPTL-CTERM sorting domain-containing protein [Xanthomonadales bacterium]
MHTGAFKASAKGHAHAVNIPNNEDTQKAASGKLLGGAGSGGNIFYLGGHDYKADDNDLASINGKRMMLNTLFVPADRPFDCGLNFGNPSVSIAKTPDNQDVNPGGTASFTLTVTNISGVNLNNVVVTDPLCDATPSGPTGDTGSDGILPGDNSETWLYTCSTASVASSSTNTGCADADPVGGGDAVTQDCDTGDVTLPANIATFHVTKDFVPDNSMEVEVFISCNDGLPLNSSQMITEDSNGVTFVVELFTVGELDCEITEVPVPGGYIDSYVASIVDGEAGSIDNIDGCQFVEVVGGDFACAITNTAMVAIFEVLKVWEVFGGDGDRIKQEFDLGISCTREITDVSHSPDISTQIGNRWLVVWKDLFGNVTRSVTVDSENGTASCRARERIFSDAVEIDNPCRNDQSLTMGQTTHCKITNTVFFEGIPTLNQHGLALLALLMLGIGAVGFRRFA